MRRNRKVKILATLGPASSDRVTIANLFRAGADVFRINMSHASHDLMRETVAKIRNVEKLLSHPLGILVDLQGPKLRVGKFAEGAVQLAAGQKLPTQGCVFFSVTDHDKLHVAEVARKFVDMGFKLVATAGTADVIEEAGMPCDRVYKVKEGRPHVVDLIKGDRIQLIVNTPAGQEPFFDEKAIRRAAVTARIPTITTLAAARAAAEGIAALQRGEVNVRALQQLHAERVAADGGH